MAAIRTENLSKTYSGGGKKTAAVQGLTLEVKEGEIFGFLGPNGAGKTSTIHLLLNLIRPSSGMAYLFDKPVTETEIHRRLGYLPESVNVHDYYRGKGLLEFYAKLLGMDPSASATRVAEMLALVKLEEAADKVVSKYSKGMLQRLGFAQAMLHDPDLLILDEPTASMDPVGRKEFRDILVELKRRGKTIFISSHILSEVESICDRVAILQNGVLKRVGSLQELSAGRNTRITIKNPPQAVFEALAATAAQMTLVQGVATIRCPDEALRQIVENILTQHGVEIVRSETEAQSLEEIFFSAITPPPENMKIIWHIAVDSIRSLLHQRLLLGLMLATLALTIFFSYSMSKAHKSIAAQFEDETGTNSVTKTTNGNTTIVSFKATSSPTNGMSEADQRKFRETMENASSQFQAFFYQVASFGGSLVALFIFSTAVAGEIRKGTIRLTLSKPVSRAQFLLGKYLGGVVVMAGYALISSGAILLFAQTQNLELGEAIRWAPWLMFCRQLMLGSLAMLLSLFMHPMIASLLAFFAGNGFYSSPNPLYFILPSYDDFNVFFQVLQGSLMHLKDVVFLSLYAVDFVAIMLLLALWRFRKKELV